MNMGKIKKKDQFDVRSSRSKRPNEIQLKAKNTAVKQPCPILKNHRFKNRNKNRDYPQAQVPVSKAKGKAGNKSRTRSSKHDKYVTLGKGKLRKDKEGKNSRHPEDSEFAFEEVSSSFLASKQNEVTDFNSHQSDSSETTEECSKKFEEEQKNTREMLKKQNRKNKKSGGFQSMGLSFPVYKGIMRKGYKIPTPIQRKTIPLIMDGKDLVAMARTGSGKTAAFLIPLFERLKTHSAKSGARALILSPTRELALQTLKFAKELGKFTGLRAAVVLGGDRMEDQFAAMHENPDIIIATPGRFMHILVEMELKLDVVEYIVFDEADRLFEMGFQEQLREILQRVPEARQTLLFSATLPRLLVDFAKAGLNDPVLVRLDVDTKLSEHLKLTFLQCRAEDKFAILLYMLKNVVKPTEQTVIFVATKYHVDYLYMLLQGMGIDCSYSYSALDPTARKINVAKFQNKKTMVLLVTDLAARGIDIPMLDIVINFNFPAKPKLFVHRVGRVARAGRSGTAYSLVSPDEMAYVLDLHLFLGRPMKYALPSKCFEDEDGIYGLVPQSVVDEEEDKIRLLHQQTDMQNMKKVISNAYKQYIKSRPVASTESIKRAKGIPDGTVSFHPMFAKISNEEEQQRSSFLDQMKSYRPNSTIFEMSSTSKSQSFEIMKSKRKHHERIIEAEHKRVEEKKEALQQDADTDQSITVVDNQEEFDFQSAFSHVIAPKQHDGDQTFTKKKKKRLLQIRDHENYLSYRPKDFQSEKGLSLGTSFDKEAAGAVMDMAGDDDQNLRKISSAKKWDRKRKKFVSSDSLGGQSKKKIKTESGSWIPASFKSNAYKEWLDKNKVQNQGGDDAGDKGSNFQKSRKEGLKVMGTSRRYRYSAGQGKVQEKSSKHAHKAHKPELKPKEQILKARRKKAQKANLIKHRERMRKKKAGGKKKH